MRIGSLLRRGSETVRGILHAIPETEDLTAAVRREKGGTYVALPDGVTHYDLSGPPGAPTVVLVHGLSVPLYIWDPTSAALTQAGFRALRYDLYGRGLSDRPRARYDEALYDRQLTGLLDTLGITGPIDLVGLSMAGSIAATFMTRRPARVRSLAFIGPGFQAGRDPPLRLRAPLLGELVMNAVVAPTLPAQQSADFHRPDRFPHWTVQYGDQMRYRGFRRAVLATLRDYMGRDVERDYERVSRSGLPVFMAWGACDRRVPAETIARIRALLPRAEVHTIPDAGHLPHYERPDLVNPLFLAFLRALPERR